MSEGLVLPDSGTRRTTTAAAGLLVLVTAVWGSTFIIIKDVVRTLPVPDFLALRFLVAAAVMVPVFWRPLRRLSRRSALRGLALGAVYGLAQVLQTFGLAHTSAAVSGFVTGMYVVLTPVLGAVLLGQRAPASTWFAVGLSTAGLGVLALNGFAVGTGELLVLGSAFLYALHIVALGLWSGAQEALGLATIQMVAIAGLCTISALPHGIELPSTAGAWAAVFYTAIVAGAFTLIAQTWAQAHLPATRAAVIMTLEPVFAALFAVLLGGEQLTARMLVGGLLVLAAMYVVELTPGRPSAPRATRRRLRGSRAAPRSPDPAG
ncbi:DMT family transporter [Angustibacter sp. McL0619]|uniref:DMT family transporter n=1 Tax=Angustibacter sp. McL0619 TaxID=3415676 RepID=UPI003CEBC320